MCGIAAACGFESGIAARAAETMCEQMHARGPDGGGVELVGLESSPVALGNRRLAIIDPSPAGHQPMADPERGTTITFNGMIYNFRELRARLAAEGERFVSGCDTEVVLRAYGRYGPDCVRHLHGMFAFAIWDERRGELFLARDRLGIKPLYYWADGQRLLCASQVKALLASGLVSATLSVPGLRTFLAYGAVSEPWTAIDGVLALPAGHRASYRDGGLELDRYWEAPSGSERPVGRQEAADELRQLLEDSVRRHLVSDAPLGVFLSGGLDSSLLAALAARETAGVRTVSVAFDDPELSESRYAELVASHIGSDHVRLTLGPDELAAWLDDAFEAMDQPSFDGINTYVVSRAAAETGLKVAVSGLGADELFGGYGYARRMRLLERSRRLPRPVRKLAGHAFGAGRGGRSAKAEAWLTDDEPSSSYALLRELFSAKDVSALLAVQARPGEEASHVPPGPGGDLFNRASVLDLTRYMKNVLLRDTDAMSMANSLEVRVPYLDDVLVDWTLRLPGRVKDVGTKGLLKTVAGALLPAKIVARRKHGFLLPLGGWMGTELRSEIDATLGDPAGALADVLRREAVTQVWAAQAGTGDRWLQAWALYALARWTRTIEAPVANLMAEAR